MWKYVTRRLKETIERAYNVLDVRKTWTCGSQQTNCGLQSPDEKCEKDEQSPSEPGQILNSTSACILFRLWGCPSNHIHHFTRSDNENSNDKNQEKSENRKRLHEGEEDPYQHSQHIQRDLINALTWSGAIICGWYATQLASLNWRRIHLEDRDRDRRYYKQLEQPSRRIHTSVSPQYFINTTLQHFPITKKASEEHFTFNTQTTTFPSDSILGETSSSASSGIYEISNDSSKISSDSTSKTDLPPKTQTIEEAVSGLMLFLGKTEFRIGLNEIEKKDYKSAVEHLKLATSHKHPGATFNLGLCYEKGLGVKKNLRSAMKCYQTAASMGHSKAIYNLGVFYAKGMGGLEKDDDAAMHCFETAAQLGSSEAKSVLSSMPVNV